MKIYYPKKRHLYTIIMLHGMYSDNKSFNELVNLISKENSNIKIILPNAPIRDIDWPQGKEKNVRAWYNYFTCMDGKLEHDTIDIDHYKMEIIRIKNIINNEINIIPSTNIIVLGESQGGTIVSGLALEIENTLGGFILLDTVFMDNIIQVKTKPDNIYIYSSEMDEVYTIELQKISVKKLELETCIKKWYVDKNVKHSDIGSRRDKFILEIIKEIFNHL